MKRYVRRAYPTVWMDGAHRCAAEYSSAARHPQVDVVYVVREQPGNKALHWEVVVWIDGTWVVPTGAGHPSGAGFFLRIFGS